jgi:hypothetical protein
MPEIALRRSITTPDGNLSILTLRAPGPKMVRSMLRSRVAGGFIDSAASRFLARLAGVPEACLAELDYRDFSDAKAVLERIYAEAVPRYMAAMAAGEIVDDDDREVAQ